MVHKVVALANPKTFFYSFKSSLTDLEYYRDVIRTAPAFSIKYYVGVALFAILLNSFGLALHFSPVVKPTLNNTLDEILRVYPEDLTITNDAGDLSVNKPQPIYIKFPDSLRPADTTSIQVADDKKTVRVSADYLVIINENGTVEDLNNERTLILINDRNMLYSAGGGMQTIPLSSFQSGEITYEKVQDWVFSAKKALGFVSLYLFGFGMIGNIFYFFVVRVLYLVCFTGAFALVNKARSVAVDGVEVNFVRSGQIALHTITLSVLLESLFVLLNLSFAIPLWFMMVHFLFSMLVIYALERGESREAMQPRQVVVDQGSEENVENNDTASMDNGEHSNK